MTVILYSHDSARRHVTPDGHPEQAARVEAAVAADLASRPGRRTTAEVRAALLSGL